MQFTFLQVSGIADGEYAGTTWKNGVAGPLPLDYARRLSASVGGRFVTVDVPHIDSPEAFQIFAKQFQDWNVLFSELKQQVKELEEDLEEANRKLATATPTCEKCEIKETPAQIQPTQEFEQVTDAQLESLVENEGIELPGYNEMKAELAAAKEEGFFDYVEVTGGSRAKNRITKAWLTLRMLRGDEPAKPKKLNPESEEISFEDSILMLSDDQLEVRAEKEGVEFPESEEILKQLAVARAKGYFDYTKYAKGKKTDGLLRKTYLLYKLQ